MAGYGTFQRTRKNFGSRRGMRRGNYSRGGRNGYKKIGTTIRPRFATVGFARNTEKKYFDKTIGGNATEVVIGTAGNGPGNNGLMYASTTWGTYGFGTAVTSVAASNDLVKGVGTGATARLRIGNKIKVNYLKGSITFGAAQYQSGVIGNVQGGEMVGAQSAPGTPSLASQMMRTTYRWCIVKDLQVNSTNTSVNWNDVFENNTGSNAAGVHAELNVDNMGRFIVLHDSTFQLTADNPQKTIPWKVSGSQVGSVRYNGDSANALTDKGIYIIYAAMVFADSADSVTSLPQVVLNSRMCFTDD